MTVLVVEDEVAIGHLVGTQLEERGLDVTVVATVAAAQEALRRHAYPIVILDLTLPDGSGLEVLDALRQDGSTAHVIVLSGLTAEADRVRALARGADDYVVKPFFVRELTARVLGVRRRREPTGGSQLRAGDLEIDLAGRAVTASGQPVPLTTKEFDLLAFLATRPGHVFSREELLRAVWRSTSEWQKAATVTEHVRRLRTKIEVDPHSPLLIQTVHGVGYRFSFPDDAAAGADERSRGSGSFTHVDGIIVQADAGTGALLGLTGPQLLGKHVFELVVPRSLPAARARMEQITLGRPGRSQLLCFRHGEGAEVAVEVASVATEWNGQPARQVTLTHLSDPSLRLRRLVTGVGTELSDPVIVTDLHFHIRSWNRAAERLYGWMEHDVLGRHMLDIIGWVGGDAELAALGPRLEETGRWFGEVDQTARDGSPVTVSASITLVHGENGEPVGVVAINRPVPAVVDIAQEERSDLEVEIRRGLDNGEFEVYYQPIVALADGRITGVEALIRWNHPVRGVLAPDAFLKTAERSRLIVELGAFVFERACPQVAAWRQAGHGLDLAVNLSARELADPLLADRITVSLATSGLGQSLWLEITESSLVEDVDQAATLLHRLASLGARIAIDDFGTGWASLTYLKRFPVHALKIDRSFVKGVEGNQREAVIVRAILSLGAELDLRVIAEGIETRAQQEALQAMGCRAGQGFLYGKATPARAVPLQDADRAPGSSPGAASCEEAAPADVVATMLRALLRTRSAQGAAEVLQLSARQLGATLVSACDAPSDALPIDLSLGEGPPLLAVVEPLSTAGMQLGVLLPVLAEHARQAVDLLRQAEREGDGATHDLLTGLVTRRLLDRVLPQVHDGVVVLIDLDDFSRINDSYGRAAGDGVLASFGGVLARQATAADISCRLRGQQFVILVADSDLSGTEERIGRLRSDWAAVAGHPVTFSAGLAAIATAGGRAALLAAAQALYRAKALGRDRTETASAMADVGLSSLHSGA